MMWPRGRTDTSFLNVRFIVLAFTAIGRLETVTVDSQGTRTDPESGSPSPATTQQWAPDPDSGRPGETVCSLPMCNMG